MALGYNATQIQGVVDAANAINKHFQSLELPENYKIGVSISVPLLIGTHPIALVTVYSPTAQGIALEPHIAFSL